LALSQFFHVNLTNRAKSPFGFDTARIFTQERLPFAWRHQDDK
jgi:hypothetical protein